MDNNIKEFRGALKIEIVSLMEKGHTLSKHIKFLKWNGPEAYDTYHRYRVNVKPETSDQLELGVAAAAIFRPIRKSCLRPNTAAKRIAAWEKKKVFGVRARHSQLLLGMLGGKTYDEMEPNTCKAPDMDVMAQIVLSYYVDGAIDINNFMDMVEQWLNNGSKRYDFSVPKTAPLPDLDFVYCSIPNLGEQLLSNTSIIKTIDIVL